eukprot:jgi/Mesen1/10848/ME000093S10368
MASDDVPSQYVKLRVDRNRDQDDNEPGELSQPIEVPQLNLPRCVECGQVLPQAYQPPQNEPWSTGIFDCFKDMDSCRLGLFCPCVQFGRNVEAIKDVPWTTPCMFHAIFVEGGIAVAAATAIMSSTIDGGTVFLLGEGLIFAWWMCGIYTGLFRQELQKKYHLKNSPCDPCCAHCFLHWCALCQEHREMKNRLPDESIPLDVINPPRTQEMESRSAQYMGNPQATTSTSS